MFSVWRNVVVTGTSAREAYATGLQTNPRWAVRGHLSRWILNMFLNTNLLLRYSLLSRGRTYDESAFKEVLDQQEEEYEDELRQLIAAAETELKSTMGSTLSVSFIVSLFTHWWGKCAWSYMLYSDLGCCVFSYFADERENITKLRTLVQTKNTKLDQLKKKLQVWPLYVQVDFILPIIHHLFVIGTDTSIEAATDVVDNGAEGKAEAAGTVDVNNWTIMVLVVLIPRV